MKFKRYMYLQTHYSTQKYAYWKIIYPENRKSNCKKNSSETACNSRKSYTERILMKIHSYEIASLPAIFKKYDKRKDCN